MERALIAVVVVAVLALVPVVIYGYSEGLTSAEPATTSASTQSESSSARGSRWGAGYFPNVELITHEGKKVRFFDDLVKDKVVVINFIFTRCGNTCPLETARLVKVQRILGDRVGRDVFFYSISIDPKHDTPSVLKKYAKKFKVAPGWLFLTGDRKDITLLRKKLGLYIDEIQDSPNNDHNLSLMVGNQSTGRWMKRSPFENPYYLAAQVGSWLHNWKPPDPNRNDYAKAPELRNISLGENLFRQRCMACHTIGGGELPKEEMGPQPGPDLLGVTQKRDRKWLARWLKEPDQMLKEKDPIAMSLFAAYNKVAMPNLQLTNSDVRALIKYMAEETERVEALRRGAQPMR